MIASQSKAKIHVKLRVYASLIGLAMEDFYLRIWCFGYTKAMHSLCECQSFTTLQRTSLFGQMSTISLTSIIRPTLLNRIANTNSRLTAFRPTAISFFPLHERALLPT